jgi:hypothetical protein
MSTYKVLKKQIDDFYVTSVTEPQDILNRIKFCDNKEHTTLKQSKKTEEAYKMPISKRILIFCCISTLAVLLCY